MSDVNTETQASKTFNAEAFAMNIAKAMETSGQALAAYLKPREGGEPKDKPPSANADAHSAAINHSLIVRSAGIRPEIPNYLLTRSAMASIRWYRLCNAKSSRCVDFARTV